MRKARFATSGARRVVVGAAMVLSAMGADMAAAEAPDAATAAGRWNGLLGLVELRAEGAKITGTMIAPRDGVTLDPGERVLEGVLIEDSLSGKLRLDAPGCAEPIWGFGLFLLDAKGQTLSGSVNVNPKTCRIVGLTGEKGLYWKKSSPAKAAPSDQAKSAAPAKPAPAPKKAAPSTPPAAAPEKAAPTAAAPDVAAAPEKPSLSGPRPEPGQYDPRAALRLTDKAVHLKNEGKALLEAGRFDQARRAFEAALRESPNDPYIHNGLGVSHYARRDYAQALKHYKQALLHDPNFGDAYYNMGCIYALQEKFDLAMRYLHIAALNGFADRRAMAADPDLHLLRERPDFQRLLAGERLE